ncbi:Uncharacterised protein [Segatella copri]|nr:Uncharacterised protein [Segatella copri]
MCIIRNLLSENLKRLRGYTEHQPTASTIEECTGSVHTILQLTCSFFQLQMYVFIVGYKPFKFLYVHSCLFVSLSSSFSPEEMRHTHLR